jgi:DNA-binding transcriptional ArsR family regulator
MSPAHVSPWDALGDPTRRAIFEQLVAKPRAVIDLAKHVPVSRPAVSQHLRVLKEAGLVVDRAEGTRRVYAVSTAGLAKLRADLDRFWDHALAAFKAAVEREPPANERARASKSHTTHNPKEKKP